MLVSQSARQPSPFSMPSKLLILHREAKSYCFTVSCVPESIFHWLLTIFSSFRVISFVSQCPKYNILSHVDKNRAVAD